MVSQRYDRRYQGLKWLSAVLGSLAHGTEFAQVTLPACSGISLMKGNTVPWGPC